ncbi:MAG: HlyD family secretion protein [Nitrospiraceae bacterium]|nr:HlyD family secretion protein [Nitrospiraceae bacterium]
MDEIKQSEGNQPAEGQSASINQTSRKKKAMIVFAVLAVVGALSVFFYIRYKSTHISTDDAFIDGHIHTIAPKISGTVKSVYVDSNQYVKVGDILVEIAPVDYEVKENEAASAVNAEKAKLAEREAGIDASRKMLAELTARMGAAKANLQLQEANLRQAETDIRRAESLFKKEAISKEKYDRTRTEYDVSTAQVKASKELLKQAEVALETQRAVVKQAEAAKVTQASLVKQGEAVLDSARLNFGYTKIYAPTDGYVTKKSVEVGNQIQPGQPLMAVVPLNDIYVTANYKETQLQKVRAGQRVDITVDTYPGKVFKGKVDSIMAGTGSVFSLFPPENATGNFVKVVQRIPVKIVFDQDTDPQHVLRMGMSVEPTVVIGD